MITTLFTWLALFLLAVVSATFLRKKWSPVVVKNSSQLLPPGEMGLPWIGETLSFYKAQRKNRLFEDFVQPRTRNHGKIFKTRLMGSPTIVVSGAEANKFFLSNEFKLVVSAWPTSSVLLMGKNSIMEKQGDQHKFVRGVIATSLSVTGLEALVPRMSSLVQAHLDQHWQGFNKVSLYRSAKVFTFAVVFECLLRVRVDPGMLETFERVLEGVFAAAVSIPGTKFWRAKRARGEIEEMLVRKVREKREEMEKSGGNGDGLLLAKLVSGMMRGEMSEIEVVDNLTLLVFAAHDTTSFAIVMTFKMLAQHPDSLALLLQEHNEILKNKRGGDGENLTMDDIKKMNYTWNVVRETMRLFPPIFGSFRKAITDIQFEGFTIPKGWKVLWTTYGTHYSEEYFRDALRFNPKRFEEEAIPPYVYLPFGGGPRVCAGYQFAKINIQIYLHYVVTRYNWSLVHPDEPITMDPLPFPSLGMPIYVSPKLL